jgi:UDP-3-O-[3-hydroxymyristoyl] glucosamine N-acyltransferase
LLPKPELQAVIIEDEVTIWGQVGTASGVTIGAKAVIMGQTGVTKSVWKILFWNTNRRIEEKIKTTGQH